MKNNLHLIVGNDQELINFYLEKILEKIDFQSEFRIDYDLSINSLSDILDEASMISMFDDKKVIVGTNFNDISDNDREYLSRYIANFNTNVYIILITGKLDGRNKLLKDNFNIIDLSKMDEKKDFFEYVKDDIHKHNYVCSDSDIEYLISKVGSDFNQIFNELNKLYMYKIDDKSINISDIDLLVDDNIDTVIYEFTNAFFDKDYDKINKMYNKFKEDNVSIDYLLVSLDNSFRQALIIKNLSYSGVSNGEIAKIIGKKEFYVKKTLERLYQYSEKELAGFINRLAIIDRDFKSGKSNFDMLELFLYS